MKFRHVIPTMIAVGFLIFTMLWAKAGGVTQATDYPSDKVFVCKYVNTTGDGEELQTGQNPISVSVNAIPISPVTIGSEFSDKHGRSVVIAWDTGQPEPDVSSCPPPNPPPPTTTQPSTSTSTSSTTSSTTSTTTPTTSSSSSPSTTSAPSTTAVTTSAPSTSTSTPATSTTTTPPSLQATILTPICDNEVPKLIYSLNVQGSSSTVATATWINPDGPDVVVQSLPLSGVLLWPGAVQDSSGRGVDWPGWRQLPDGTWVEGDEFDWVRPSVTLRFEVNPSVEVTVGYPPSSPVCNTSPPAQQSVATVPPTATTAPQTPTIPGGTIPETR